MTHIIVATHGKFSEEIVNSAAMVYGEDENCQQQLLVRHSAYRFL